MIKERKPGLNARSVPQHRPPPSQIAKNAQQPAIAQPGRKAR